MTSKAIASAILLLSLGCWCIAQSRYNNQIQPGSTTRSEVDKVLGPPIHTLSLMSLEYKPPAGASHLQVDYNSKSIVEHVEATFIRPYSRTAMLQALKLADPVQPQLASKEGRSLECFGPSALLVFTFSSGDGSSKMVSSLGYYSRELFSRACGTANAVAPAAPKAAETPVISTITEPKSSGPKTNPPSVASPATPAATNAAKNSATVPGKASDTTSSDLLLAAASEAAPAQGLSSGTLNWSGPLQKEQLVTFDSLPGVPVMIDFDVKHFSVVEPPSPSNGWKRLVIRSKDQRSATVVTIQWKVIQ